VPGPGLQSLSFKFRIVSSPQEELLNFVRAIPEIFEGGNTHPIAASVDSEGRGVPGSDVDGLERELVADGIGERSTRFERGI